MKAFIRFISLLLMLSLVFNLAGCKEEPKESEPDKTPTTQKPEDTDPTQTDPTDTDPTQPSQTDPEPSNPDHQAEIALYTNAVAALLSCPDIHMEVTQSEDVTVNGETFPSSSELEITYLDIGTETMAAKVTETAVFGEYETEIEEIYADGTAYASVYGSDFCSSMTAEEYTARYIPVQLLDASLYESITAEQTDDGTTLLFSEATALENWVLTDMSELIQASGEVSINSDGEITKAVYTAEYSSAGALIQVQVTADYSAPTVDTISTPKNASSHTQLTYLDGPRMLEQIFGYINSYEAVSYNSNIATYSDAAAVYTGVTLSIHTHGSGSNLSYKSNYSYYGMDYYNEESYEYEMEEYFLNGKYTSSVDGGAPETNRSVTSADIDEYVLGYLAEYVFDCSYFSEAVCTDLGSLLLIEFTGKDELGEIICKEINYSIFGEEDYLDAYASDYRCDEMTYYIGIDKYLGLPTSIGMYYAGTHVIDGYDYTHFRQVDQYINMASMDSYESIHEVSAPDVQPETHAKPVFYHVTGADGQELWLLGTIHVGDDRTGFLPQEIYDAYNASDALAVECNTRAFDEECEKDEALQESVSNCYYYADGSTTEDHVTDPEVYKKALQLMKATGNYFANAPYVKVPTWSNSIDNYFLTQCYTLSSDKGVDNRLLMMAEADGKKILEVESSLFQIQMLTGWSDALSMDMLEGSLETTLPEYYASITEMYELWCSGDEAALIEYLKEDTSELTEEELVLYNEYNKAMSWDRNEGMTQVAIDYLESGETVFYAVGLAHVLAEDGLVNTLRAAGYTVELVEYN